MNIPPPPAGFVLDGQAPQQGQPNNAAPPAPPPGFTLDAPQKVADASLPSATSGNLFDAGNLQAGAHAAERWTQFGAGVLASPQKAQVEAYAASKGVSVSPQLAGEWLKSTIDPAKVQQLDNEAQGESKVISFIQARDQLAGEAAKQFKAANPGASDQEMYRYVHQNLLAAGKDNSKLPAFTLDPQTLDAKTDVGVIHGLLNRTVAGLLAFPTQTAEAGGRLIQQGVYEASKPFYADGANPYEQAVKKQNEGIAGYNQAVDQKLQGSTLAKENPIYGMVEEGVAQVPSLLLLSGLGKAGSIGKVAEWGQVAGTEFSKAYDHVYNDALSQGASVGEASDKATMAGAVDAAVNTYLMTKGTLGQQGGAGLKGRLRAALTGALPQGGVAGGQELVRQLSSFALTGKDPKLEAVLDAGVSGTVTGAIAGGALGHPGDNTQHVADQVAGTPGHTTVNGVDVPAPSPEQLKAAVVQPHVTTPAPVPASTPTALPKLVESAVPKFRVQSGDKSVGVKLEFENPQDKALYVATESRKGKRSQAAIEYLQGQGFNEESINAYGDELRLRVDQQSQGHTGDTLRINSAEGAVRGGATDGGAVSVGTPDASTSPIQSATPDAVATQGVNNAAPQTEAKAAVTSDAAPASTEGAKVDPAYLPARNRDTAAAIADAGREVPNFKAENPATKSQAEAADAFRKHGVELVYYTGEGRGVRLSRHDGVLFINKKNVASDLHEAVSHEFMHELKANRPALFAEFLAAMPKEMVDAARAEYASKFAKFSSAGQKGEQLSPAKLDEEAVTYTFGKIVSENPGVWKRALGEKPDLLTKVVEAVKQFVGKLTGNNKSKLVAQAIKTFEATLDVPVGETKSRREVRETTDFLPGYNGDVRREAAEYTRDAGISFSSDKTYATVDVARAKKIAKAYDLATHSPNDPQVKASYEAFKKETLAQWEFLKSRGVKFDPWGKDQQPYQSSAEMLADIRDNRHLGFFQGGVMPADHPLAEKVPGTDLNYNDVFRAVHDYFGHAKEGVGFGPRGEENAWRSHSQMYSDVARGAMTAETRGQNSWVNFGPHGETNQADPKNTKYAEQKATILPSEFNKLDPTGVGKLDQVIADLQQMVGPGEKTGAKGNLDDAINILQEVVGAGADYLPSNEKDKQKALDSISSVPIRETPMGSEKDMFGNLAPVERQKIEAVAKALNDRTRKLAGQSKARETEKLSRAVAAGIPEIEYQLKQPDSGKSWYKEDIAKMEKTMKGLHPSLEKPENMTLFKAILAVTSQGNNPNVNLKHAEPIYAHFDKTGNILAKQPSGINWPGTLGDAFKLPLGRLEKLVADRGRAGAAEWLLAKHPISELREINPNVSGPQGDQAFGMEIFGPKIGVFALNQHGIQEKITKDMWFSRTWNRWMGTMMDSEGNIVDAPRNDAERQVMDKAVNILAEKMKMDPSEVQAVLWYHEQQLFKAHGAKVESGSYSKAAEKVAAGDRYDLKRAFAIGSSGEAKAGGQDAGSGGLYAGDVRSGGTGSNGPDYLPGKFLDEDLVPAAEAVGSAFKKAWTGVRSIIAPQTRGPQAGETKGIFRERGAEVAQRFDRVNEAFKESKDFMDKLPVADTRQFIDDLERGRKQTNSVLQPIADALRAILDDRLAQVQALGTGKLAHFVADYFPHLWKDPTKAAGVYAEMAAKAPLQGGKKFLKKRSLPFFADGIAKGLEPVTENPVEAMTLRVREMDKYITAQQAFAEVDSKGFISKIKARDPLPLGYAKINDNIATIYAKPSRKGALQIQGYYVAPEPVANVINNYLSPGIRGNKNFGPLFRGYLGAGNVMNQVQLGLSFFHLLNTTIDSSTSRLALAFKQGASGQFKDAAKSVASAATILHAPWQNWTQGNLLLQEWNRPGSTTPEIAQIVEVMKAAGGRTKMDDFYHTGMSEKMMEAFRKGNVIGGLIRSPFAGIEQAAKPVMEKVVPRMKMGVFMDMARYEIARLGPGASREAIREAAGKAWDSVDNRMGELVYDNLFWNKAFKDMAMASTRSVGWNLGTFRELGGGVIDLGKAGVNLARGKQAEFSHRMAYAVAMPMMAGLIGGVVHRLLTGKNPSEFKDWFFPKTGEKDKDGHDVRLALPSYMKDVLAYAKNPGETLANKTHPMLNTVFEMMSNQDYYGTEIRNADDPYVQQALDLAKHAGKNFIPFGVREVSQLASEGQGSKSLLPLIGIVKARKDITNSDAESLASEITRAKRPQGTRTHAEADKAALVRDLSERLSKADPTARNDLNTALKAGLLTESDLDNVKDRIKFKGLERSMRSLDMADAMKVWGVATDDEKVKVGPVMFAKLRANKSITLDQRKKYMAQLQADWSAIKGKK